MTAAVVDRERLAKLLGMLGSAHDGEVAAAGRAADAMVRRAGSTWHEVMAVQLPAPTSDWLNPEFETIRDAVAYCLGFRDRLTDWEIQFCQSLRRQSTASQKQQDVVKTILAKLRAGGGDDRGA